MAHPPPFPDPHDDVPPERGPDVVGGRPRWPSVLGIALVVAMVLLVVALHLAGVLGPEGH